ncbi:MAG: type II toxin-antitoxin system HicB family antitoxin [Ignavibacteriaceae bacterium]
MVLDIILIKTDDGFTAEIPSLNGCECWAHEEDAALEKIIELASYYLKVELKKFKLDRARRINSQTIYKLVFTKLYLEIF